jgi:hypothetical protein
MNGVSHICTKCLPGLLASYSSASSRLKIEEFQVSRKVGMVYRVGAPTASDYEGSNLESHYNQGGR